MDLVLYGAELVGTVAFALSGAMLAAHKGLDLFGVLYLGVVTALGGGTVRDLLLGITPPKMFYSYEYVALAVVTALVLFLVFRRFPRARGGMAGQMDLLYNLCDAVGLGIFAVVGTQAGMEAGYGENAFLCVFLGLTTGVGGGILRDIMADQTPYVLCKHVYACASIAGALLYIALMDLIPADAAMVICSAVVFQGTTVTLHPRWFRLRTMFSLMPQSTATTSKRWLEVREYQRFLQLTRLT